jgi:hypothetical protein
VHFGRQVRKWVSGTALYKVVQLTACKMTHAGSTLHAGRQFHIPHSAVKRSGRYYTLRHLHLDQCMHC